MWFLCENVNFMFSTEGFIGFIFTLFDDLCGNYEILLSNLCLLAGSSIEATLGHNTLSKASYKMAAFLGIWFLWNQISELFSVLSIFGPEVMSSVLLCLFCHLSHLLLSLILFLKVFYEISLNLSTDNIILFVSAYWHLVEIVWIILLMGFLTI
jgi:heme/copper-type cytochrome/quinol oxidase subunit 3